MDKFQIDGIVPIVPTPFHANEEVDDGALRNLLDFATSGEVRAICLHAYVSEFYKLTEAEREEVVVVAIDHVRIKPQCRNTK